jgi:hypothetical protein
VTAFTWPTVRAAAAGAAAGAVAKDTPQDKNSTATPSAFIDFIIFFYVMFS